MGPSELLHELEVGCEKKESKMTPVFGLSNCKEEVAISEDGNWDANN